MQEKARDFPYETEYETADPHDPGFYNHCGGLFLPDTGHARHRRRLDELYPRALYLLLFSLWGYSIDRRIIQKQALHCLRLTAALMLVWLILRTLKYEFVTDLTVARYIWYLYYLPMLFIPLLGVYIALTLGKSEEYRLTERAGFLVAVPGILFCW